MIRIGTPTAGEGPGELLLACHARIRSFTGLAARLASSEPASAADVAEAAARVHRYYSVALPLHQADEELSLAPRLERVAGAALLESLSAMKDQHVRLDEVIAGLLPSWERLVREPAARAQLSSAMAREIARLEELWTVHLGSEETAVFPALRLLPAPELTQIAAEMRARRADPGAPAAG